jgi:hypothetical protein
MKPETRQKLITLYWNWCRRGRDDFGLPYSLGDLLHQANRFTNPLPGEEALPLEQWSEISGLPVSFVTELRAAVVEGVTDEEIRDLAKVQAAAKRRKGKTEA